MSTTSLIDGDLSIIANYKASATSDAPHIGLTPAGKVTPASIDISLKVGSATGVDLGSSGICVEVDKTGTTIAAPTP
jgi:hypothetical protein